MERLTVKRKDGRWAIANNDGASSMEQMEKLPSAINRLAAYEDTGLEPEDIAAVQEAMAPILFGRFRDIMEAERAGRLVVLPCKVGDMLFAGEDSPVLPLVVADIGLVLDGPDGWDWESSSNVGKTVFLTREEAEAALKKGEEADNEAD